MLVEHDRGCILTVSSQNVVLKFRISKIIEMSTRKEGLKENLDEMSVELIVTAIRPFGIALLQSVALTDIIWEILQLSK